MDPLLASDHPTSCVTNLSAARLTTSGSQEVINRFGEISCLLESQSEVVMRFDESRLQLCRALKTSSCLVLIPQPLPGQSQAQLGFDTPPGGLQPQLLQPRHLGGLKFPARDIGQRRPTPT